MPTKTRIQKVEKVLSQRQPDLHVVLEEITNTHNASAVVRTCDAAGILHVDIIYANSYPFPVNEAISTRSDKWLNITRYNSTKDCLVLLKEKGYRIVATHLQKDSVPYNSVDYTQPTALIFGNESEGISDEALQLADDVIKIPMFGMAQSLNLSVSVGIILYEAIQQRAAKSFSQKTKLSDKEFEHFKKKWLKLD